jgi:hypothetical protein
MPLSVVSLWLVAGAFVFASPAVRAAVRALSLSLSLSLFSLSLVCSALALVSL